MQPFSITCRRCTRKRESLVLLKSCSQKCKFLHVAGFINSRPLKSFFSVCWSSTALVQENSFFLCLNHREYYYIRILSVLSATCNSLLMQGLELGDLQN